MSASSNAPPCLWLSKLSLSQFRNYSQAALSAGPEPVILIGQNGAGKTNCLEAVSLLSAGRGLRRAPFAELANAAHPLGWALSATLHNGEEVVQIGTGLASAAGAAASSRASRVVKIDGVAAKSSTALSFVRVLWLTPAMDGLFTGAASERRRFLDRFVLSFSPPYASAAAIYDRAMRQRNRALETEASSAILNAFEEQMSASAMEITRARMEAVAELQAELFAERDREQQNTFPHALIALAGRLEAQFAANGAAATGEWFMRQLHEGRERDRQAARALIGPHRADIEVRHGPKNAPAKICSTGEQKALLVGLVLAQARLSKLRNEGIAPLLLLDEIAAHFDKERRLGLFEALCRLGAQTWMTGTEQESFQGAKELLRAQIFLVAGNAFHRQNDAESGFNPQI